MEDGVLGTANGLDAETREHLYIQLFEAAPLPFLVYGPMRDGEPAELGLIAANAAARALPADVRGEGASVPADTAARLSVTLRRGETQQWTVRAPSEDGRDRIYVARCFPLDGRRVALVLADATDRHEMEKELARHVYDLERTNRDLDEFAYVASHDLKSPLRDVNTLATFIAEDAGPSLPEGSRRHLRLLTDRIQRMERLLEDLLAYSRASRTSGVSEPVDVRAAAENAIAVIRPPEGFTIRARGRAELAIPGAALEQIIRNLVDNAVKHHDRSSGAVDVVIEETPDEIRVEVRDDGPGILPQYHGRVFRIFQTLRPRDEKEGSGMGLAIVKRLVEATGGRVAIESTGERGTTFQLSWPRRDGGARP